MKKDLSGVRRGDKSDGGGEGVPEVVNKEIIELACFSWFDSLFVMFYLCCD